MAGLNYSQLNNRQCVGFEQLVVGVASTILASIPATATGAIVQVESDVLGDKAVRYREDGTAPTAAIGMFIANAGAFDLTSKKSLKNFKVIQAVAGTTKLNILYYK